MRSYLVAQYHRLRDEEGNYLYDAATHEPCVHFVKTERVATQEKAYAKAIKAVGRSRHIEVVVYKDGKPDEGWRDLCRVGYILFYPKSNNIMSQPDRIIRFQNTSVNALETTMQLFRRNPDNARYTITYTME